MKVLTVRQMQNYDSLAANEFGIPPMLLMENAGRNVAEIVEGYISDAELFLPRVVVVCGPGNNGGDGFVAARHLYNFEKCQVRALQLSPDEKYRDHTAMNREIAEKIGVPITKITGEDENDIQKVRKELKKADIIVDAILGIGLKGDVRGFIGDVIASFRDFFSAYIISVDIPSGVCGDTGRIMGNAVRADETVTFAYAKTGLLLDEALDNVGHLHVTEISIPPNIETIKPPFIESPDEEDMLVYFPVRPTASHKGDFGHLLLTGGCEDFRGAPLLACEAALKCGVGLVTMAGIPAVTAPVVSKTPDIMTHNLKEKDGCISHTSIDEILKSLENKTALAFGCGLGQGEKSDELVRELLKRVDKPILIDADGLNALAKDVSALKDKVSGDVVLTPHPGEMARLTGLDTKKVQADRVNIAREFAMKYGVTLALKGARSIIASADGQIIINPTGTPGMAVGGMGDVLAGAGGAFMAQGFNGFEAMKVACYIAGLAGEILADEATENSVTASALIEKIPLAIASIISITDEASSI